MNVLMIGNLSTSFIKNDYKILKKHFNVDVIEPPKSKLEWFKYHSLIREKVAKNDVIFGWFAGWHTAFGIYYSKKYNKKSVIVIGGYDVSYAPDINYGAFNNIKERIPAKYVLKNTDLLLAVSEFSKKEVLDKVKPKRIKVVYSGINVKRFVPFGDKEDDLVITVGGIKWSNIKRKGLETFVKSAKFMPNVHFVVIGRFIDNSIDYLKSFASSNVEFTGFVSDKELVKWYQKAKVYAQLSYHEGFGISVAEAMSCECIPVVTGNGALPEVAGYNAYYTIYDNYKIIVSTIEKALCASNEIGEQVRKQILEFSMDKRENLLVSLLGDFI